jgi:glycosyltransferase involved in cell wall biosynthesis
MAGNKKMPHVSVVIPCKDEEMFILDCIRSVLDSDYPAELLEVLICDGNSKDLTAVIVRDFAAKEGRVLYLLNKNETTPFGLNLGIRRSKGDIVVILGAHAQLSADYISKCVGVLLKNPDVGCAGGALKNECSDQVTESIAYAMSSPFGVGNAVFRTGTRDGYVDTVAFGVYRKEVFNHIGMFDEELTRNQDDEFNYRLLRNGYKIWLISSVHALYHVRATYLKLFKQYFQYGYWKIYVNQKHKRITSFRQVIPALFVTGIVSGILLSLFIPWFWRLLALVCGVYLAAAAFFSALKSKKKEIFIRVIYAFLLLHLGYGIGYMKGIFDFLFLRRKPSSGQSVITR